MVQQLARRIAEDGGAALIGDYGHDGTKTDTFRVGGSGSFRPWDQMDSAVLSHHGSPAARGSSALSRWLSTNPGLAVQFSTAPVSLSKTTLGIWFDFIRGEIILTFISLVSICAERLPL